jgi:hypothetical protein
MRGRGFPEKADEIIGLMAGTLDQATKRDLIADLRDPASEASQLVEAIQRLARAKIDISRIPGMEEIAREETAMELAEERRRREGPSGL